jgi:hypothetical protein
MQIFESNFTLTARPLLATFEQIYSGTNFAAFMKSLQKKTTEHRLATKIWNTGRVFWHNCSSSDNMAEITAVPISSNVCAAKTG